MPLDSPSQHANYSLFPTPYSLHFWCTGEDSNLRSSQGAADLQSAAINRSATCAHIVRATHSAISAARAPRSLTPLTPPAPLTPLPFIPLPHTPQRPEASGLTSLRLKWGSLRRTGPALILPAPVNSRRFGSLVSASFLWSWRRDLNPRPSDYKSDALPAELRQLVTHGKQSRDAEKYADTLQLSAYTAQNLRLAQPPTRSKRGKTRNGDSVNKEPGRGSSNQRASSSGRPTGPVSADLCQHKR